MRRAVGRTLYTQHASAVTQMSLKKRFFFLAIFLLTPFFSLYSFLVFVCGSPRLAAAPANDLG